MSMYPFTFLSRVKPKSKAAEEFRDFPNAYINCYVHFKDFRVAEKLAKLLIRERGWIPGERTAAWELQKSKIKTKAGKQLYAEALKYGYTLAFYLWSMDDEASEANRDAGRMSGH
jgi:hypothetical protein